MLRSARTRTALVSLGLSALAAVVPFVHAPAERPAVHLSALEGAARGAKGFQVTSVLSGKPVRWNPCAPIHWVSNSAAGPAGGVGILRAAVAHVASVTGTTWVYDGEVGTTPTSSYLPAAAGQYPPVLLGWTDGRHSDLLAGQSALTLGMTRTAWYGMRSSDGTVKAATHAAVVALNAADRLPLRGPQSWSAVALHELGHVMGLAHSSDSRQLMAPVLPTGVSTYQAGDLAGLKALGSAAGCVAG